MIATIARNEAIDPDYYKDTPGSRARYLGEAAPTVKSVVRDFYGAPLVDWKHGETLTVSPDPGTTDKPWIFDEYGLVNWQDHPESTSARSPRGHV